jgi:hypothetical protein
MNSQLQKTQMSNKTVLRVKRNYKRRLFSSQADVIQDSQTGHGC